LIIIYFYFLLKPLKSTYILGLKTKKDKLIWSKID